MDYNGNYSLLGGPSALPGAAGGRSAAAWRGQRGPAALKFCYDSWSQYYGQHMQSIAKGKDLPCIAGFESVKQALPSPEHQSHALFEQLILAHEQDIALAQQGLLGSKELSRELRALVLNAHAAGINTDAAIATFMAEYDEVWDGFAAKGLIAASPAERREILDFGISGRDWLAVQAGNTQPSGEVAGLALYMATEMPAVPPGLEEAAAAGLAKRREIQQQAEIKEITEGRPMVVLTGSRRHTANSALLLRLLCLMRVIYGPGDESQYSELMQLRRPGAQEALSIPDFAARIEQLHTAISLTNHGVEKVAHLSVFVEGLNSPASRSFARTFCENRQWRVMLREVMEETSKFEQNSRDLQLLDMRQSALLQGAAGRKPAAGGGLGVAASEISSRLAAQQQLLERMPPEERAVMNAAFELTKINPNNPNAVCMRCRPSTKPHTNAGCRNKDKGESSGGKAHGSMAQGVEGSMQALLGRMQLLESQQQQQLLNISSSNPYGSSGNPYSYSSSSNPYGFMPGAMAAAAAGPATSGLPRAYNKPEGGGRFKGSYKGNGQSGAGCPTCGFGPGHPKGAVCYQEQPALAPAHWAGPSSKSTEKGIIRYIKGVIQGGLPLKLRRCSELATQVMPQLTPHEQQRVRAELQQLMGSMQQQHSARMAALAHGVHAAAAVGAPFEAAGPYITEAQTPSAALAGFYQPQLLLPPQQQQPALMMQQQLLPPPSNSNNPFSGTSFGFASVLQDPYEPAYSEDVPMLDVIEGKLRRHIPDLQCNLEQYLKDSSWFFENTWKDEKVREERKAQASSWGSCAFAAATPEQRVTPGVSRAPKPKSFRPAAGQQPLVDGNSSTARQPASDPMRLQAASKQVIQICPHGQESTDSCLPCRNHNSSFMQGWSAAMQECTAGTESSSSSSSLRPNVLHDADPGALAVILGSLAAEDRVRLSQPKFRALLSTVLSAMLPANVCAGVTALPDTWQVKCTYTFQPLLPNHVTKQQERQSLDRLTGTTRATGITLTISDGRSFLLELTIIDSGADTAILTEACCKKYGVHIITTNLPQLLAIDGKPNNSIIGRTGPLVLTLAQGTPYAANLPLPNGALVMKGDAGGLYDFCLDKQTLHAVYGYVDPALGMLLFRPRPEQDMWLFNGIPVTSAVPASRVAQLRAQGLLAPASCCIQEEEEEEIACALAAGEAPTACEACSSNSSGDCTPRKLQFGQPEIESAEPAVSTPVAQPSPASTAASSTAARPWAAGILPGMSSLFALLLTLVAGCFAFCVDMPLNCWPSRTFSRLLELASTPIRSKPEPAEPPEPIKPKRTRPRTKNRQAADASKGRTSIRFSFMPILARLFLALLLCMCTSTCSVAAMQFGSTAGSMAAGQSPAPMSYLLPDVAAHKAVTLLQHELTRLPSCYFAAAAAEGPDIKWYKADPSALDVLTPDGISEEPHDAHWTIHPEGKWVLGNHPEATSEQMGRLVQMLEEEKDAFAYDLADLPGYSGEPISFQLIEPGKRMWCPPRQYAEHELTFGDEKIK